MPGSSEYFLGGIIAYSNEIKERVFGVRHNDVETTRRGERRNGDRDGARGTARAGRDIAISVTGIAGPGGGTADKPVGLVYIAIAAADFERVERFVWDQIAAGNKWASSEAALQMVRDYLATLPGEAAQNRRIASPARAPHCAQAARCKWNRVGGSATTSLEMNSSVPTRRYSEPGVFHIERGAHRAGPESR